MFNGMNAEERAELEMHHTAMYHEEKEFFESLNADQLAFLIKILRRTAVHPDVSASLASRFLGNAETYMIVRFGRCGCGKKHDQDADIVQFLSVAKPNDQHGDE